MTFVRAQVVFQAETLLPEDRFVNTFHFDTGINSMASSADAIFVALADFYEQVPAGSTFSLGSRMSAFIAPLPEVRLYDLADPEPRVPLVNPFTLTRSATKMPEEVALVLSIRGAPPVTPRRRGRLYIGPWGTNAVEGVTTGEPSRPVTALRQTLANAAEQLIADLASSTPSPVWVIRSTVPTVNYVPVVGGFVDNTWDTQRRRGPASTSRIEWP